MFLRRCGRPQKPALPLLLPLFFPPSPQLRPIFRPLRAKFARHGNRFIGMSRRSLVASLSAAVQRVTPAHIRQPRHNSRQRHWVQRMTVQGRKQALAEFSKRFLNWVEQSRLEARSKTYYQQGWNMLSRTPNSCCPSHAYHHGRSRGASVQSFASECEPGSSDVKENAWEGGRVGNDSGSAQNSSWSRKRGVPQSWTAMGRLSCSQQPASRFEMCLLSFSIRGCAQGKSSRCVGKT